MTTADLKCDIDGCVVFCKLVGTKDSVINVDNEADRAYLAELMSLTGADLGEQRSVVWYCLGHHSWCPYRSTYKVMIESSMERERLHGDEVFLQAV